MKPNKRNFCGGAFPDWLEVNLTDKCNGNCSWCIEKEGYHPEYHAPWQVIANAALAHGALNIILLGGEPTLFRDIYHLIAHLVIHGRHVWITTNGSLLTRKYVETHLPQIYGVNISIHDYDLNRNATITGVVIKRKNICSAIKELHKVGALVRLNCNCIQKFIDSSEEIVNYINFAKSIGADKVRFAELKQDDASFVDLAKMLNYKYGLNDNPFLDGCISDVVIKGMPVNFRQMCGLQTSRREKPENPDQIMKKVLYYDGKIYDGWQTIKKENIKMNDKELVEILEKVSVKEMSVTEAALAIDRAGRLIDTKEEKRPAKRPSASVNSPGCQY